jgi:hypothetical protein
MSAGPPTHDLNSSSLITMYYSGLKQKHILKEGFHILSLDHTTHCILERGKKNFELLETTKLLPNPH